MVNVAIAGVGEIGRPMVEGLFEKGIQTTVLSRKDSTNKVLEELKAKGIKVIDVDYDDDFSIAKSLQDIDVVISCLSGSASDPKKDVQLKLAKISRQQNNKVRLFIPSMWGIDYDDKIAMDPKTVNPFILTKSAILKELNELKLPWIAISNGMFTSWSLSPFFGFDLPNSKVSLEINPKQLISWSNLKDIADFVAKLIQSPEQWPSEGQGKWFYVESFKATYEDILETAQKIDGNEWKIDYKSSKESHEIQQQPTPKGMMAWIIACLDSGRGLLTKNDNAKLNFTPSFDLESSLKEVLKDSNTK